LRWLLRAKLSRQAEQTKKQDKYVRADDGKLSHGDSPCRDGDELKEQFEASQILFVP
jgi:hypothetical protein